MRNRLRGIVPAIAVLLVVAGADVTEAGRYSWRCCNPRPVLRPLFIRPVCVPVQPVVVQPVPVQAVPVDYPTPVRNLLFGTHRLIPACKDGTCDKQQ